MPTVAGALQATGDCGFQWHQQLEIPRFSQSVQPSCSLSMSASRLNQYLKPGQSIVINLLSMEEREGKSFLARYFADYWKTEGLKVRIVSYHIDFEVDKKEYIQAQQLSVFWQKKRCRRNTGHHFG